MDQIIPSLMPFMIVGVVIAAYFAPSFVAYMRNHNNRHAICCMNVLLGWTVVFWVACLIWSLTDNTRIQNGAVNC